MNPVAFPGMSGYTAIQVNESMEDSMRRGTTFWGIVFILFGTILLLQSLGILQFQVWTLIGPGFLILLGVWIIFGVFSRNDIRAEQKTIPLEGAREARVTVKHGAGRIVVKAMTRADQLVDGTFAGGLDVRTHKRGDVLDVDLQVPSDVGWMFPWAWQSRGLEWDFALNDAIPLSLAFETGASETRLDLSNLRVRELSLKTGASSMVAMLPANAGQTRVRVEGGATSVVLNVPANVGARVRFRGGLATAKVDHQRFRQMGEVYETADYATAPNKIDIDAEMGVGSLEVR
jgi:hypothetical protein